MVANLKVDGLADPKLALFSGSGAASARLIGAGFFLSSTRFEVFDSVVRRVQFIPRWRSLVREYYWQTECESSFGKVNPF